MTTIQIGMSRAKLLQLAANIQKAADQGETLSLDLEGVSNDSKESWITVTLSNDDMERPEVADKVYVDIDED
jgi:hypothetical protein